MSFISAGLAARRLPGPRLVCSTLPAGLPPAVVACCSDVIADGQPALISPFIAHAAGSRQRKDDEDLSINPKHCRIGIPETPVVPQALIRRFWSPVRDGVEKSSYSLHIDAITLSTISPAPWPSLQATRWPCIDSRIPHLKMMTVNTGLLNLRNEQRVVDNQFHSKS